MRIKCFIFKKMSSLPYLRFLGKKIKKVGLLKLNVGSIRKYEVFFSRKKRFHFLKRLHENGKAQNMPVLASRLVKLTIDW